MGEIIVANGGASIDSGICFDCLSPMGKGRGRFPTFVFDCTSCDTRLTVTVADDGCEERSWRHTFLFKKTALP